ncbi:hypothetical protein F4803DRAFT_510452 [Xylaria telfairii]|nr:hypothetical protein F4803DRAFT_510452 [Xylaria telfairii]
MSHEPPLSRRLLYCRALLLSAGFRNGLSMDRMKLYRANRSSLYSTAQHLKAKIFSGTAHHEGSLDWECDATPHTHEQGQNTRNSC